MIRGLTFIAVGGALVSALCFGTAASRGPTSFNIGDIEWNDTSTPSSPEATRTVPWSGSSDLTFNLAANILVRQGEHPSITLSGPQKALDAITFNKNTFDYQNGNGHRHHSLSHRNTVTITVVAPALNTLILNGFGTLDLENYSQNTLDLTINGAANVRGTGKVEDAKITIDGAASVNLAALSMRTLNLTMDGAGSATAGPTDKANIIINGAGSVKLTEMPKSFSKEIDGIGSVSLPDHATATPAPQPPKDETPPTKQDNEDLSF